jgi:hypothetical protein
MVPYKDYESRLLNGSQCSYFVIVAILLTFVHESKPDSGQPLAEVGISHGHLRCSRSSGCNKDAFGRNDTVTVITPYINLCRVSFSFAFFNTAKESSKLRQCWGAEIADLISKGFRRDILLGVDDCREVIELTAEGYKQDRQGARLSSAEHSCNTEV